MFLAILFFLITLVFIFLRPWNLSLWIISLIGAFFVYIFKLVNWQDIIFIFDLVWGSSLTLLALMILSFVLEILGFFDFIAIKILAYSKNKNEKIATKKLMFFLLIFVFFLTAFLGNDGAILIITPIVIAIFSTFKNLNESMIVNTFLLSVSFLCDASSNTLVISNLTNLITANYFNLDFLEFTKSMFLPSLFVLLSTLFVVCFIFLRSLPHDLEIKISQEVKISTPFFLFCICYLILFVFSFFIAQIYHWDKSLIALCESLFLWFIAYKIKKREALSVVKHAPWGIFIFSFGLYIVVFALHKCGVGEILSNLYQNFEHNRINSIMGTGFVSALLSSIFNNLPMTLIGDLALKDFSKDMIYAHLLGVNIGSKLTPIGSLATLFWLELIAKRGIRISFLQYCKFSFFITLIVLFFSFLGLILK
ncbi:MULTISPECIES: arsenic transporter [Campylobacter]|uniref:Arsenic transporter n=1 Tax=Campylobacter molothri TaxID=1032242 RepID=A0ACC5W240_9BACT|nr:arsenic transporter [Campylobacter sp. RM10543]MBZ7958388.1 arsenic transporter [Campylobacter sp. RM9760]MBZ7972462.1 arsenic transporter [Campylobacter sp. RM9753]MBZ7974525.1 arsenic transporter [Campylobacter sp. RM9754]